MLTDLESVPFLFVAGEADDLCVTDKPRAAKLLSEQNLAGVDTYGVFVRVQGRPMRVAGCLTADLEEEARRLAKKVADLYATSVVQETAEPATVGVHLARWQRSAPLHFDPVYNGTAIALPDHYFN